MHATALRTSAGKCSTASIRGKPAARPGPRLRSAEAKLMTFDQCRDAYIESHRAGWKSDKHAGQWKATLSTYASPVFGKLASATLTPAWC